MHSLEDQSRTAWAGRAFLAVAFTLLFPALGAAQFAFDEPWPPTMEVVPFEGGFIEGGTGEVVLKVMAESGIHVYRDKIEASFEEQAGVLFEKIVLPEGSEISDILNPGETIPVLEGEFLVRLVFRVTGSAGLPFSIRGALALQGCTDEICYLPASIGFAYAGTVSAGDGTVKAAEPPTAGTTARPPSQAVSETKPTGDTETPDEGEDKPTLAEILGMIFSAFGIGILLSLTPCVLPIIPITSAVILRYSKGGTASALLSSSIYVLGLAITYAVAGVFVAFVGASVRSFLASPAVTITIGAVFVLLSLSMFGVFDIGMPSSVATKVQQRTAKGGRGVLGLLAMGALSGIVIGPCITGPILGLLLFIARSGSVLVGFVIMFTLAWGMGLLIIAAGTFTGLVPKAGMWMEWFKKLFGFVLLWGALYFLAPLIGDFAFNLGSALVLVVGAVFLGGLDTLAPDAGFAPRLKKLTGVFCLMSAFFLAFNAFVEIPAAGGFGGTAAPPVEEAFQAGGEEEVEAALAEGKPAVLYFTTRSCPLCKVLKKNVLKRPEVVKALEGIAALKIDLDEEKDLGKRFNIKGAPTLVFIDREGKERKELRFSGADETVEEFIDRLKQL